jgi:FkbM family methyltransferase
LTRGPIKRQTLQVLLDRRIPVRTVLDVGVLDGTWELVAAYPDRLHVLFEPVAEFAPAIEQRYRDIPHVLVQAAVSDASGETQLLTVAKLGGGGISHSYMVDAPERATRTVAKVSLDDHLRTHPAEPPYFLKIDVDGEELKVLDGAAETLKSSSIVMIEVTVHNLVERVGRLLDAGFQLFDLTEPAYYDDSLWQCDAVFIRSDVYAQHFEALGENLDIRKYAIFGG